MYEQIRYVSKLLTYVKKRSKRIVMELLEKLDILSGKVDELLVRLSEEQDKNARLENENVSLRGENKRISEQNEVVRSKVENLLNKL